MGVYEVFVLTDKKLNSNQMKALKACKIAFTTSEKVFQQKAYDDESTILIEKAIEAIWVKESYITASNIAWKEKFRKIARLNKIHIKSIAI
jgi:hypothetical protein